MNGEFRPAGDISKESGYTFDLRFWRSCLYVFVGFHCAQSFGWAFTGGQLPEHILSRNSPLVGYFLSSLKRESIASRVP